MPRKVQITYDRCASGDTAVYLDGKRVGTIVRGNGERGFRYVPAGKRYSDGGEMFKMLEECQRSLEEE